MKACDVYRISCEVTFSTHFMVSKLNERNEKKFLVMSAHVGPTAKATTQDEKQHEFKEILLNTLARRTFEQTKLAPAKLETQFVMRMVNSTLANNRDRTVFSTSWDPDLPSR